MKKIRSEPFFIAHYTELALRIHLISVKRGFFSNRLHHQFKNLQALFEHILHVEDLFLAAQIEKINLKNFPLPSNLIVNYTDAVMSCLIPLTHPLYKQKYQLLTTLAISLIDMIEKFSLQANMTSKNFFVFFAQIFERDLITTENFTGCSIKLDLLNLIIKRTSKFEIQPEYLIYLRLTELHYMDKNTPSKQLIDKFIECSHILTSIPMHAIHWSTCYKLLVAKIEFIFKIYPLQYKVGLIVFLKSHSSYFNTLKPESYDKATLLSSNVMHRFLRSSLLDVSDPFCLEQFLIIKSWFIEKQLDSPLLDILELKLIERQLKSDELFFRIKHLMYAFANWVKTDEQFDDSIYLIHLFDSVPEKKAELIISWNALVQTIDFSKNRKKIN